MTASTSNDSTGEGAGPVLVTAATGTVGRAVVRELAAVGVPVRAASRDPERARERFETEWLADESDGDHVEYVAFDFQRPETYHPALDDASATFLVRPPEVGRVARDVFPFVDAAERMGVEHAVVLSVLGAEKNPLLPHRRIEKHVAASGLAWTFLRASFFLQNLLEVHRADVVERDRIFLPAGDGETSFVDARDVGAVAAEAFQDASLRYRALDVTGAEALTYHEVAAVMTDVLDREITYANPGVLEYARTEYRHGTALPFVLVQLAVYGTARLGLAGRVTDDVERVLGREPRSVREFVEDHADAFAPASDANASDAGASDAAAASPGRD
ncbi:NmrA family NAD(P)-binding protein [Halorubellus litoreus]|uniref:NmrA family NAD(P)-binding protein n=1 Tax=Halorubellus litoreus TaxID=755308 RepID=A0ABD5V9U8_9EURY